MELPQFDFPTGEAARQFLHIVFRIVTFTQSKTAPSTHGRSSRSGEPGDWSLNRDKQALPGRVISLEPTERKSPSAVSPEQAILLKHQCRIGHFFGTGGKMPMPQKRHPLQQRMRRMQHDVDPPGGKLLRIARRQNGVCQFIALPAKVAQYPPTDAQSAQRPLRDVCLTAASIVAAVVPNVARRNKCAANVRFHGCSAVGSEWLPSPLRVNRFECRRHRNSLNAKGRLRSVVAEDSSLVIHKYFQSSAFRPTSIEMCSSLDVVSSDSPSRSR